MFKYFSELLKTLKRIDSRLADITENTKRVSNCVKTDHHSHGDKSSL